MNLIGTASPTSYVFSQVPHWNDSFRGLKEYRSYLHALLLDTLSVEARRRVALAKRPEIGIHIRLGDFQKLAPDQEFREVGSTRTPIQYFVKLLNTIRLFVGREVPATIFSDGTDAELAEITVLPSVRRVEADWDAVHLFVLSTSRVIIQSAGSTFSQWATFLSSETVSISHHDHDHTTVRDVASNTEWYEGSVEGSPESWPQLLKDNLSTLLREK